MEKQQVFYIHGGAAYRTYDDFLYDLQHQELRSPSNEDAKKRWTHSFRADLGEAFEVFTPAMPNSENSKYEEWKIWFERHIEFLRDGVILVGWSQGAMFFTRYLAENELPISIKHLFLVAGVVSDFVDAHSREDGGDFYADLAMVPGISEKVGGITILHSKDDFVVPYEQALQYKELLPQAELVTFEDKNHFLIDEFPELIERIKAV